MKDKNLDCVGIIMDGNRRWAKERGLNSYDGHSVGYEKLKDITSWAKDLQIKNVVVYAFSTENWKRSEVEVNYLMKIFKKLIFEELNFLKKENARIVFVGQIDRFSEDIQRGIKDIESETKENKGITLFIALSYGGRSEILNAVSGILNDSKNKEIEITEDNFARYLWTKDMPDPDLIIRTGGEMRLSNFLPWQSIYSELFFTKTYWPDFSKKEFNEIILDFKDRKQRFGK